MMVEKTAKTYRASSKSVIPTAVEGPGFRPNPDLEL
jgi:hypothetical protein